MRKYGLSCMIFIQAVGQIKNLYKDDWETLMGACDTMVYLGGNELSSMEDLAKKLGDQTIRVRDNSYSTNSKGGSSSKSFKYTKRALLTVDEIRRLKSGYCIVLIKGQQPFYDKKYLTHEHVNAKYLGDLGKNLRIYTFDYCNTRPQDNQKLEKARKRVQENILKQSAKERNPSRKAYQTDVVMPGDDSPEEIQGVKQQVAAQSVPVNVDKDAALVKGATVKEVKNGKVSVQSLKPDGAVATSSKTRKTDTAPPDMADHSLEDYMDLLDGSNW